MHIRETHRYMTTFIDYDPLPPIYAIVIKSEDAMLDYVEIYRDPNTRFHVRTWSWECVLTPLALAVAIATLDFANILSVLVNNAGIDLIQPCVIDDLKSGLCIRTNALTHLHALWERDNFSECLIQCKSACIV